MLGRPLTKTRLRIWLGFTAVYVLFTAWFYYYAFTCHEMFCTVTVIFPGLPWSILFISLGFKAWVVLTPLGVLLNTAILYLLLRIRRVPKDS